MYQSINLFIGLSWISASLCSEIVDSESNITDPNKDMYVIHAMVYQVGILTNKSDEEPTNMTGNREAVTFYHTNGTDMDLSGIPEPLLTNVTAQSMVALSPASSGLQQTPLGTPWDQFKLASIERTPVAPNETAAARLVRSLLYNDTDSHARVTGLSKKNYSEGRLKIEKGTAIIPEQTGVTSLAIPPLIGFNNKMSDIPVPIPNTSVVRYAKVNTLVQTP